MKSLIHTNVYRFPLLFLLISVITLQLTATKPFQNHLHFNELPDLPPSPGEALQPGVSAPFAGVSNNVLLVAGGANFPEKPVWENGKKAYYDDAYALEKTGTNSYHWHTDFKIPFSAAYGVSITTSKGVICIGGKNNDQSFSSVFLMYWDPVQKKINTETLPSLPFSMSNMAGALVGQTIYLAGGMVNDTLANAFLSLDLSKWDVPEFGWTRLPDFPGPPRLQAVGIGQDAAEEQHFYLFSGSSFLANSKQPLVMSDGLEYNPGSKSWSKIPDVVIGNKDTLSLHGANGIPISAHHILFIGGVNRKIFGNALLLERKIQEERKSSDTAFLASLQKKHYEYFTMPPDSFKFNKDIVVYHTITKTWTKISTYPYPGPAGAPVIKWLNGWVVVNGEVKPGVRSPRIYFGKIQNKILFGSLNWIVLGIYLFGMLFVGYFFMQREKSTRDFFKAGGRIPWWAAGISIFATVLSAITYITIPAKTFATDWKYFVMACTIPLVAWPIVRFYLPFFQRLNVTTAYEYLEKRFNYSTRFLASILFQLFMIARMALVLFLPSLALSTVAGINIYLCILLMGIITIAYCTMGGVEAVVWGDVIQGIVLLGGAILTIVYLTVNIDGGLGTIFQTAIDDQKFHIFDFALDFRRATFWVVFFGGIALNLIPYSSDQSVIQRYMATKDEKAAAKGIWFNGLLSIPVSIIFYFIGTGLYAFFKTHPAELSLSMNSTDSIFPHYIMDRLPMGIAGLLIAAIFAASMSTISANVNSISTAFTIDFFKHFRPRSSDKRQLNVARFTGVFAGGTGIILALFMATWNMYSLFDYFNTMLGLLAGGLAGLFALGIFFPKASSTGALWGFILGTITLLFIRFFTDISFLLYGFIGILSVLIYGSLISYFFPDKSRNLKGLTYKYLNKKA